VTEFIVIGAGPAGVLAALRAAELGAQTALVTSPADQSVPRRPLYTLSQFLGCEPHVLEP